MIDRMRMVWTARACALLLMLGCLLQVAAVSAEGADRSLLRFPDVHGDTVVFVQGGDIWKAPLAGGTAVRLTTHDGSELYPHFSPDGSRIAFTGEYDGNGDVYVMDTDGASITRVTFHPGFDQMVGWHPVEDRIIFRSARQTLSRANRLYTIRPDGTGVQPLIMIEASQGSYDAQGKRMVFNKLSREFRTWKRYRGGLAQDVYLYDFDRNEERRLTEFEGTDRYPMWIGDTIYFTSDREYTLNIFAYDLASRSVRKITGHSEYDVRHPGWGGTQIVYENGGEIWHLDTAQSDPQPAPLLIQIPGDDEEVRPVVVDVADHVTDFDCAPSGKRAAVVARGEIFTVPAENGSVRNLSRDCGANDRGAAWSPDGSKMAFLSDRSGEYEIYVVDATGHGEPQRLTRHESGYRHTLRWSPDGKMIAYTDETLTLHVLDVKGGKIRRIDKAEYEDIDVSLANKPIHDFTWSPDSRYLAYSKMEADLLYKVFIHDLQEGRSYRVSGDLFEEFDPAFSRDGRHLFLVSNRHFAPTLCDYEWEMVYKNMSGIYALTLQKDGGPFLPLRSDEAGVEEKDADSGNGDMAFAPIDFENLAQRVEMLPLPAGNYRRLSANDDALFYLNAEAGDFNRFEFRSAPSVDLCAYSFVDRESKTVISGIDAYKLSADGAYIAWQMNSNVGLIAATDRDAPAEGLDLSGLRMTLDPVREWRQIFDEAWRLERDFYYEPGMRGHDWQAMGEKYRRLLQYASCREDIRYLIGELIGELNTSHTYVRAGDNRREAHLERVSTGMLGCDWQADSSSGRYRIARILSTPDWTRDIQPPLRRVGLDIAEGDYVLAVNGNEVSTDRNIFSYFVDLAGKQVELTVNSHPEMKGSRTVVVVPIRFEGALRYLDWVETNRQTVDRLSGGQIGYMHFPDTYMGSAREFGRQFYGQTQKQGLVIDGRFNNGGLDPDIFLSRLDRPVLGYWTRRHSHHQTNPSIVTRAHMACITNHQAGSGGDMLPYEFRLRKMGPIVGTRSWGGLVGVSQFLQLIDGSGLTAPDYRIYDTRGNWVVENEGVAPDVPVELDSVQMSRGHDDQLEKAVELIQEMIRKDPLSWPQHEEYPLDR